MTISADLARAIEDMALAGRHARDAIAAYEQWQRGKSSAKFAALQRIMREPNALSRKAHSVASAESVVEQDQPYVEYLAAGLRLQLAKHTAEEAYEAARLIALYHATRTLRTPDTS